MPHRHVRAYLNASIRSTVLCLACATAAGCAAPSTSNELLDPASGAMCTNGQNVRITKSDFSVVLDGACGEVVITASNGSINVDHARSIRVEGQRVSVLNEKVDTIDAIGSDNTFNMTEVGHAIVSGDRNTLLGHSYERVTFKGKDNTVNTDNSPNLDDQGSGNKVI